MELDRVTRGKEHHDFLGEVLLEEGEQEKKSQLRGTHNVALYKRIRGGHVKLTTLYPQYLPLGDMTHLTN